MIDHREAEDEPEEIATKSRPRIKKKNGKDGSPSKIPEAKAENTNLLAKPKNDDSSESSSIKDSGFEEAENDGTTKNNKDKIKSTDSGKKIKRDKGSSGTVNIYSRKTAKLEAEQSPPPVFKLHEINSIWASCDGSDDEETGETSVGLTNPLSARTIIG